MNAYTKLLQATLLIGISTASASASEKVNIVFSSFFPPQNFINTKVLPSWSKEIREATDGRVNIILTPKSVAPPSQLWEAVTQGMADATYLYNGFLPNDITLPLVSHLPNLTSPSSEKMSVALWNTYDKHFKKVNEYGDKVELLSLFVASPAEFYSITNTAFEDYDQLKNGKLWALPGTTASVMSNIGVSVVTGPAARIHEFVSHGVVDAFVGIPYSDADAFKASGYIRSVTEFDRNIFAPSFSLIISKDKWNQISAVDQKEIKKLSGEYFSKKIGSEFDKANAKSKAKIMESGVKILKANDKLESVIEEASMPLYESWMKVASEKGVDAAAAIKNYDHLLND